METQTSILTILALVALGLLITVSGGMLYLTFIEWRDRRRKDNDQRTQKKTR